MVIDVEFFTKYLENNKVVFFVSEQCRDRLVEEGILPTLVETLPKHFSDPQASYYAAAALSNFAVNSKHRMMMIGLGHHDLLRYLIELLSANVERVRCQACLALRNLASDGEWVVKTLVGMFGYCSHVRS